MLHHQRKQDSTRSISGLLCCLVLAAAVAGCANTPKKGGIPWWPQAPGNTSEDVRPTASVVKAKGSDTSQLPSTRGTNKSAQAVRYGDLLFVSGQIADDQSSLPIAMSDIQAQVRTAMDNVNRILESHGLTMSNVLSVNLYLQDLDELPKADEVYASYFQRGLPARSVMRVSGLPNDSLVEISVIAGK
jgi:2-iminobutanoate/2-iminopropanoate deaminase